MRNRQRERQTNLIVFEMSKLTLFFRCEFERKVIFKHKLPLVIIYRTFYIEPLERLLKHERDFGQNFVFCFFLNFSINFHLVLIRSNLISSLI